MSEGANAPRPSVQWLVWTALALTILGIAVAFIFSSQKRQSVSADLPPLTPGLPSFTLTNQLGSQVTPAELSGKVSVVDVVFTRCAGPCPEMTRRMSELQRVIPADLPARLVTLTTDPEYDTPEVLRRYAARYNADPNRWWFLTGSKSNVAVLARHGLKLVAEETRPEDRVNDADLFVHSTVFVLLDKSGRLRGAIESTESDLNARVLESVRKLAREP